MPHLSDGILVKSHIARDLLQNAALFKTDRAIVWEYVANSLQYVERGRGPVVRVSLDSKNKKITIADNGRGMDWRGLHNFFVMHGENVDRKQGHPGRGRYGTGKSAAFGIADLLRITSVRSRKRSIVELTRLDVEKAGTGEPIPVRALEKEVKVNSSDGTVVEIEGIHLRALDQPGVIRYIEKHLARWPRGAAVYVNNHECEYSEPPIAWQKAYRAEGLTAENLGEVELVVKVAAAPLDEDMRGISIFSRGVWYETSLVGSEGREMSQYIFGEVDVPKLDEDKSPIAPFDASRSMRLNPNNDLVQAIYAFVGQKVEEVRRDLLDRDRRRRADEEAKKLEKHAAEIANLINEDFESFRKRVTEAKAKAVGKVDPIANSGENGGEADDLFPGTQVPADVGLSGASGLLHNREGLGKGNGHTPRGLGPGLEDNPRGVAKNARPAGTSGSLAKARGGFQVKFQNIGTASNRAQYIRDERAIYINLDHPQVVAAKGTGTIENPSLRRLAYEIAFSEYAIALASELAARDEYLDPQDPIFDIRETLNRIARKGAKLYSEEGRG